MISGRAFSPRSRCKIEMVATFGFDSFGMEMEHLLGIGRAVVWESSPSSAAESREFE
jgi:hypothetical protein